MGMELWFIGDILGKFGVYSTFDTIYLGGAWLPLLVSHIHAIGCPRPVSPVLRMGVCLCIQRSHENVSHDM